MSEATMYSVFNSKIVAFNKALKENNVNEICAIGSELLQIGFEECIKSAGSNATTENYKKQCMNVASQLIRIAKTPSVPTQRSASDDNDNDPYYSEKQWFSDEVPKLNFTDMIGAQEVKDAFLVDVVAPLQPQFKDVYHKFRGDQLGSQILLYGPPGTGKTHLVRCLAGALNCRIAVVQTSEILASVVGVAEKNMRDVFAQAEDLDRCIIFLDEIDSICSDRNSDDSRHTKSILTTMLTCMDGFLKKTKPGQLRIIIAATNLPWKLDSALKRGGRFETQIYVPLPDLEARKKMVNLWLGKLPRDNDVTVDTLANMFDNCSGADIKAMIKQIANRPLRREIMNIYNDKIGRALGEKITMADCREVIGEYINPITPEMMRLFDEYAHGGENIGGNGNEYSAKSERMLEAAQSTIALLIKALDTLATKND